MPRRSFHRSQSEALPPIERAYRRAARELRDFHRARSLDVILEEDHHDELTAFPSRDTGSGGGMLKKKGACLCLADLVDSESQDVDGSENSVADDGDGEDDDEEQQSFGAAANTESHHNNNANGCWGHFTVDSPSSSSESDQALHHHHHLSHRSPTRLYPSLTHKGRTIRRFGRS